MPLRLESGKILPRKRLRYQDKCEFGSGAVRFQHARNMESYSPGGLKSENFLSEKGSHLSTFVTS
jgi:hypothetical protein